MQIRKETSLTETLQSQRVTISRCFFAAVFMFALSCAQAQTTLKGALALLPSAQIATLTVSATTPSPGTQAAFRDTNQTLVPNLVGGGQVNYGDFAPTISILKSLPIL